MDIEGDTKVEEEEEECRICRLSNSDKDSQWIRPCQCTTHVHRSCLEQWRASKLNEFNMFRCEVCLTRYRFKHRLSVKILYVTMAVGIALSPLLIFFSSAWITGWCFQQPINSWLSPQLGFELHVYMAGLVFNYIVFGTVGLIILLTTCCSGGGGGGHCYYFGDCHCTGGGGDEKAALVVLFVVLGVGLACCGIIALGMSIMKSQEYARRKLAQALIIDG
eukprot:GILJ01020806.1.p1 GENE.GILJ01020806.1~~GILJ01020806.1.p1  ORF type:complete len:234 (+),score=18.93 GILJ01020806.1:43-702(+)